MRADESLGFKLERWTREARELATCSSCYGVGEDRDAPGRACPVCSGRGRAAREPHVLELVSMVRDRDARLEATAELVADRSALLTELESQAEQRHELEGVNAGLGARVETLSQMLTATLDRAAAAEAEVERLRGIVEVNDQRLAAIWDEARAEVERLRDELGRSRRREGDD